MSTNIEYCQAPFPDYDSASFVVPQNSCDTHAHVVNADMIAYPMVDERSYTPPPAQEEAYLNMLKGTGMERGVLVQISVYGTDNRYMLEVLERNPKTLRGIAVVDENIEEAEIARMDALGVRGIRINVLFGGGIGFENMERLAAKIAPFGWHIQLLLDVRHLPELMPRITKLPVPVVVDHMGHMPSELGVEHPGFQALLELVKNHSAWTKLSGAYRIDSDQKHYSHAARFAEALCKASSDRMVYGSDWPHVAVPYEMPNTGRLRNSIGEWFSDADLRQQILVDNPARLYGF